MDYSLQVKKGIYYAVFRIEDNGETKQKWLSTKIPAKRGNKREACKIAQELVEGYENSMFEEDRMITFCEMADKWLAQKECELDPTSVECYRGYYKNHIYPYFHQHEKPLASMTTKDVQSYYNEKAKDLSGNTIRKHHVIILGVFQEAARQGYIQNNPAGYVVLPKKEQFTGSYYTVEQSKSLMAAVDGTTLEDIVPITIFYGLRRSEVLGLQWSAINFENNTFTIQHTVVRFSKNVLEKDTTKNKSSHRTYPMTPEVRQRFLRIKERQAADRELTGDSYVENDYVFKWPDGHIFSPSYVSAKFKQILQANNLPIIRFHDLRHTTASLLLAQQYDLKYISEWLGHSDISTTANIYAHLGFESKKDMSNVLSNILQI